MNDSRAVMREVVKPVKNHKNKTAEIKVTPSQMEDIEKYAGLFEGHNRLYLYAPFDDTVKDYIYEELGVCVDNFQEIKLEVTNEILR